MKYLEVFAGRARCKRTLQFFVNGPRVVEACYAEIMQLEIMQLEIMQINLLIKMSKQTWTDVMLCQANIFKAIYFLKFKSLENTIQTRLSLKDLARIFVNLLELRLTA